MDWWSDILPQELRRMMDGIEKALVHKEMHDEDWDVRRIEGEGGYIWNAMCTSNSASIRLEYREVTWQ